MSAAPAPSQLTDDGRERFGRNVAYAWGGYMVNVIAGFVVPRLISDQLGQVTLGVWDFAWSFVAYFGLVQLGMGGSISRYVACYRARNDVAGLNRSVSTIATFQRSVGWLALVLAVVSSYWILPWFGTQLGDSLGTTRWVLLFLGAEVALTISLSVYGAVVVGCHRWDLHNTVSAVAYGLVAFGMVGVLLLGGGLPVLALVHCTIMVGAEAVRWRLAYRICPELRIERRLASWSDFKEQARYSVKSLIPSISDLLSNQALSLLITAFLGPASLAVFSRSRSLMTTLRTLAVKFGMIVVPTASALQAKNDRQALRATLLTTPAIISSLALPVVIAMGILGDLVIRLWMGEAYVLHGLVAILAVGTYATLVQEPVWSLLSGMNVHGRIALAKLGAAVGSALLLTVGLWLFHWGLLGAAVCFALPQLLVDGLCTPWYACHVVGVCKRDFLWRVFVRPICCVLPFALALGGAAMMWVTHPFGALGTMILGALLSGWAYSRWLVSLDLKKRLFRVLRCRHPTRLAGPACSTWRSQRDFSHANPMKSIVYRIADVLAWRGASGKRNACDSIGILMLHGVHDRCMEKHLRPPANSMPIAAFVRGVQALARRYQIVSLDAAIAMLSGRAEWQPRSVVLTFDDSLHCLLPTAAKWLAASELTATFFLSTEVIDKQRPYWWKRLERAVSASPAKQVSALLPDGTPFRIDPALGFSAIGPLKQALKLLAAAEIEAVVTNLEEQLGCTPASGAGDDPYARVLSWKDVRELVALGMTIGSHTVTHPNLAILPPEQVRVELIESRERIQVMAGVPCQHLCYPYGAYAPAVCTMARDVGYQSGLTTHSPGWNYRGSDLFALRRFAMPADAWRVTPLLSGVSGFRATRG